MRPARRPARSGGFQVDQRSGSSCQHPQPLDGRGTDRVLTLAPSGSAERTKGPVLEAVQPLLDEAKAAAGPGRPLVLEIASGLGEHVKVRRVLEERIRGHVG